MPRIENYRSMDIAREQFLKQNNFFLYFRRFSAQNGQHAKDRKPSINGYSKRKSSWTRGAHFMHHAFFSYSVLFWNPKQKSIEFPSNSKCLCIHVSLLCFDFISINVTSSSHNKAWYLFRYIYVKNWHGMVWELYNVQECSFKCDIYVCMNFVIYLIV